VVHFRNNETSTRDHSVDFHAVTGPGGGAVATQTPPGEETSFQFQALNAGIFIYHCASGHIPSHIAMGMYGMILVEPPGGLPAVDREFYVVQGELYSKFRPGTPGHHEFDGEKMRHEEPEYVVFNGRFQALTGDKALTANTNETVRIYFGNAGPNLISSFHVIGEIFDRVYTMGDLLSPPALSVQTTPALPGGATAVEMHLEVPARYLLVDHAISRTIDKGALGFLEVTGPENPDVYQEL
jgi:nitrite reductase (NO-forming)